MKVMFFERLVALRSRCWIPRKIRAHHDLLIKLLDTAAATLIDQKTREKIIGWLLLIMLVRTFDAHRFHAGDEGRRFDVQKFGGATAPVDLPLGLFKSRENIRLLVSLQVSI